MNGTKAFHFRTAFQCVWAALSNGYVSGFLQGKIYQGAIKGICVPGLNCYSCPGAFGSCPVGSFQAMLAGVRPTFPLYVLGFLFAFGALFGRFVCGWLCPFGFMQELLWKVPFPHKVRCIKGDGKLRLAKYVIMVFFVIALPLFMRDGITGSSDPFFCKYVCPSGTIFGGWILSVVNSGIRGAAGVLFTWKSLFAVTIILLSVTTCRPFCKYLCPLGAFYALFNKVALLRLNFEPSSCIKCKKCSEVCPMGVCLPAYPNGSECIRCGACIASCPTGALSPLYGFGEACQDRKEVST